MNTKIKYKLLVILMFEGTQDLHCVKNIVILLIRDSWNYSQNNTCNYNHALQKKIEIKKLF